MYTPITLKCAFSSLKKLVDFFYSNVFLLSRGDVIKTFYIGAKHLLSIVAIGSEQLSPKEL